MIKVSLSVLFLILLCLPASAQEYYSYYRIQPGDSLVSIALQFGVDRGAIMAMNPSLSEGRLEPGSLLCVPNPQPQQAGGEIDWDKLKPGAIARRPVKPVPKAPVAPENPTPQEISYLERYGTVGQAPPQTRAQSVMTTNDGRTIEIPSRGQPVQRRRSLSSRRGRAIFGLLKTARGLMGIPYVWGGEQATGADCSGYVQLVFARHGVKLPRTADIQYNVGKKVSKGKEQPGDLVFFETYAPGASHVGIYLGQRKFIHASSRAKKVTIGSLEESYFQKRYLGARRHL